MKKYRYKEPIEACQFKEGMESGWQVDFVGRFEEYNKTFETKQKALNFIKNKEGINYVDIDDIHFNIIYKEPIPYLFDVINGFLPIHHMTDYIVRYSTGRMEILNKREFETLFEEIDEYEDFIRVNKDKFKKFLTNKKEGNN